MRLESQLVHCDGDVRVVRVSAHEGDRRLGSALGEAATAEEAESRAMQRLRKRLGAVGEPPVPADSSPASPPVVSRRATGGARPVSTGEAKAGAGVLPEEAPEAGPGEPADAVSGEPAGDPEDWSPELARLDLELQRIGWGREQEARYLQRAFGHPSRSRLTIYADLMAYLGVVGSLPPGADPITAQTPLRRGDLLRECDRMLERLGWEAARGRRFLQEQFGVGSRQRLSDQQLLQFNMLLENELMSASGPPTATDHGEEPPCDS